MQGELVTVRVRRRATLSLADLWGGSPDPLSCVVRVGQPPRAPCRLREYGVYVVPDCRLTLQLYQFSPDLSSGYLQGKSFGLFKSVPYRLW